MKAVASKYNTFVQAVREAGEISLGELSVKLNLSPATIYQYWRAIKTLYDDIEFLHGVFKVKK